MAQQVKFYAVTASQHQEKVDAGSINAAGIYFLTDKKQIYKGGDLYGANYASMIDVDNNTINAGTINASVVNVSTITGIDTIEVESIQVSALEVADASLATFGGLTISAIAQSEIQNAMVSKIEGDASTASTNKTATEKAIVDYVQDYMTSVGKTLTVDGGVTFTGTVIALPSNAKKGDLVIVRAAEEDETLATGLVAGQEYLYTGEKWELIGDQTTGSSISDSVTSVQSSVDTLTSSVTAVTSSVDTLTSSVTAVTSSVETLNSSVTAVTSSVETLSSSVTAVTSSVDTLTSSVTAVTSSVETLNSSVTTLASSVSSLIDDMCWLDASSTKITA